MDNLTTVKTRAKKSFGRYTAQEQFAQQLEDKTLKQKVHKKTTSEPDYLSETDQERRRLYIDRYMHYNPGKEGIYRTKSGDGSQLFDELEWNDSPYLDGKNFPTDMVSMFNPFTKAVDIDAAALCNEFHPEGITVADSDSLTEALQEVYNDNDWYWLTRRLFTLTGSMGDCYVRCREAPWKQSGIELVLYPADRVFPVIEYMSTRETAFRIWYKRPIIETSGKYQEFYVESAPLTHYEIITPNYSQFFLEADHVEDKDEVYDYQGDLPMVHFTHRTVDGYYGIPSLRDELIDDTAHINHELTILKRQFVWLSWPQLYGPYRPDPDSEKGLMLGSPYFYPTEEGKDINVIQFQIGSGFLETLTKMIDIVEKKIPQYALESVQKSLSTHGSADIEGRYGPFLNYERMLENDQKRSFKQLSNTILRMKGLNKTPKDFDIEVNLGPPINKEVTSMMNEMNQEMQTFKNAEPVVDRWAKEMKYTPEEIEQIKETLGKAKESEEFNTKYKGNRILFNIDKKNKEKQELIK